MWENINSQLLSVQYVPMFVIALFFLILQLICCFAAKRVHKKLVPTYIVLAVANLTMLHAALNTGGAMTGSGILSGLLQAAAVFSPCTVLAPLGAVVLAWVLYLPFRLGEYLLERRKN